MLGQPWLCTPLMKRKFGSGRHIKTIRICIKSHTSINPNSKWIRNLNAYGMALIFHSCSLNNDSIWVLNKLVTLKAWLTAESSMSQSILLFTRTVPMNNSCCLTSWWHTAWQMCHSRILIVFIYSEVDSCQSTYLHLWRCVNLPK